MPKVDKEYIRNKRNKILDAAFSICIRKPVYEIVMRDIITESGLSQGGIYRYFSSAEDIFYALINRETESFHIREKTDNIIESNSSPEQMIAEIFTLISTTTLKNIRGFGKIYFELVTVLANHPERYTAFHEEVRLSADMGYLQKKAFESILEKVQEGYFKPRFPLEDIFSFLITSIDGIERDMILAECYQYGNVAPAAALFDRKKLMNTLYTSFILLLNGDKNNTQS